MDNFIAVSEEDLKYIVTNAFCEGYKSAMCRKSNEGIASLYFKERSKKAWFYMLELMQDYLSLRWRRMKKFAQDGHYIEPEE